MRISKTLVAGLAVAIAAAATAQGTDPIAQRQAIMKQNGKDTKALAGYAKGETPYDAAAVTALFAEMNTGASKFGALFPPTSKSGGKTEAAPAIWEKPAIFQAAVTKFEADTAAAAKAQPATVEAMRESFGKVTANCKSCHETFRVKTQ